MSRRRAPYATPPDCRAIASNSNTEFDSVTALTTAIAGALALTPSCTVFHNTQVRLGRREADTDTVIDLVCNFQ
ncbi:DUF481 domain-containing protein [Thiomonas sp. X19]|uniref:DUF481 domain-containing protein n=1 Tax=Thiomonas sp. X19 TaxID=1050370 RepID=UPI000DDC041E|nr:DUF481 domain-containing protein [Thiomonas sp. X19]